MCVCWRVDGIQLALKRLGRWFRKNRCLLPSLMTESREKKEITKVLSFCNGRTQASLTLLTESLAPHRGS